MSNPYHVLGLPVTCTKAEVRQRYLTLAQTHHPDMGGDAAKFSEINQSYVEVLKHAPEQRPCERCGGTGMVEHIHGFSTIKLLCPDCGGERFHE